MATNRRKLEAQAARIETVLAAHNISARVVRGSVTPRAIHFDLKPAGEMRVEKLAPLAGELARAAGSHHASLLEHNGLLRIALPRPHIKPLRLTALTATLTPPALTAALGVGTDGAPLLLRLPSPNVGSLLIQGVARSGKTALARTLITSLAMFNPPGALQIVLIDRGRRGFAALSALPHIANEVAGTAEAALESLNSVGEELGRREREKRERPALLLVIDDVDTIVQAGGRRVETLLAQVAQRGRAVGIFLVACAPADSDALAWLAGSFRVRLVSRTEPGEDLALETPGRFILTAPGEAFEFQAAWLGRRELDTLAAHLRAAGENQVEWGAVLSQSCSPASTQPHREVRSPQPVHSIWRRLFRRG